jgi:Flp pilus assembly protein TadD
MDRRLWILAAATPLVFSLATPAASSGVCDPYGSLNDQARTSRSTGLYDDARATAQRVLEKHPGDFRASYTEALARTQEYEGNRAQFVAALNSLVTTSKTLGQQDGACAIRNDFYSIYNTIGTAYYTTLGDYKQARFYFELGVTNLGKLGSATSKIRVLHNLALADMKQGDFVCAEKHADDAKANGDTAADGITAAASAALLATNDQRKCTRPAPSKP